MSETREVQYYEGEASVILEDGQSVERGKPVTVSAEIAEKLCNQGWTEIQDGKPVQAKPTPAAAEKAAELQVDPSAVQGSGGPDKNKATVADVEEFAGDRKPSSPTAAASKKAGE